jgi:hypothetical protein
MFLRGDISIFSPGRFSEIVAIHTAPAVLYKIALRKKRANIYASPPLPPPFRATWGAPLPGVRMCACVGVAWPSVYSDAGTAASLPVFLGYVLDRFD